MPNTTIKAINKRHLKNLIKQEIKLHGVACSLNHIDVSDVTNMSVMFHGSAFNGDISQWNTSNVTDMEAMFSASLFNGDISQWNVSNVVNMAYLFQQSKFDGDISQWDTSSVKDMSVMLHGSAFKGDLRPWNLTQTQMSEAFMKTLPNYLTTRQNIEEAEKLHAAFGSNTARAKKAL